MFLISLVIACSNDNEQVLNYTSSKVIVQKTSPLKTRASLDEKNLYSIQYKNIYIKDVPLNDDDVTKLQVASSLSDPIPVSVKKAIQNGPLEQQETKEGTGINLPFHRITK